jgi:hypothetical protein
MKHFRGILLLTGGGALVYGIWQMHVPTAFIVAGLLLMGEALAPCIREWAMHRKG